MNKCCESVSSIVLLPACRRCQHQDRDGYNVIPEGNPVQVPENQERNIVLAIEAANPEEDEGEHE